MNPPAGLIYVKSDKPIERQGAIILPATSVKQTQGIVFRSGSTMCKPGDRVMYARFWPIELNEREYLVVNERDLVGIDVDAVLSDEDRRRSGLDETPPAAADDTTQCGNGA